MSQIRLYVDEDATEHALLKGLRPRKAKKRTQRTQLNSEDLYSELRCVRCVPFPFAPFRVQPDSPLSRA